MLVKGIGTSFPLSPQHIRVLTCYERIDGITTREKQAKTFDIYTLKGSLDIFLIALHTDISH